MNRPPDAEVEYALNLYYYCREFRVLPRPGGLLDQDYYEMQLLRLVGNAYVEKAELDQKRQTAAMPSRPHI